MMFFCLHQSALQRRAKWSIGPNQAAWLASLSAIAVLTSCGANPRSTDLSPGNSGSLKVTAQLPTGTQGSSYSGNLSASGGTSPYKFVVTSGQMPEGINLDQSAGNLTGTPSAAGNFSFGVTVSDSKGASTKQGLQIAVSQAAPPAPSSPPPGNPAPPSNSAPPSTPPTTPPASSGSGGNAFSNLQAASGWGQYGQGPPDFVDCSPSPCNGIEFSMTQGISTPSLSGNATVFWIGGTAPYSDALWNNHVIGPYSSQGIFDTDESKTSSLSEFTYDVDFYGDNLGLSEALEFDINQFFGGMGFIFGHQCKIANGNEWDIWDNSKGAWIPTGIPCYPNSGQWNHLTLKVQRTSDNHETYQSITLNGQTANLNWTFDKGSSPGWYGVTVNFQMDGNYKQDQYKVYLDNLTLSYQ